MRRRIRAGLKEIKSAAGLGLAAFSWGMSFPAGGQTSRQY
jgi:hypothetical protein